MPTALSDLTVPLTSAQIRKSIYDVLAATGVNTTGWKPGSVVRTLIYAQSSVLSYFSRLIAEVARSSFLESAAGDWLDMLARNVYGVDKQLATFASGNLTLVNTGGASFSIDANEAVFSNLDTGATYRNSEAFELGPLETKDISIYATEAGSASTSLDGTITGIVTELIGVTCSNAYALVGLDDEEDGALRNRCREKLGSLSPNGPWDAYAYVAKGTLRADGTTPVDVNRVQVFNDSAGHVTVRLANASGAVSSPDLALVTEEIQKKAVPIAVTADVVSATALALTVTCSLYVYSDCGLSNGQILAKISADLATFLATQPIGGNVIGSDLGKIFADSLLTVIRNSIPEIYHAVLSSPSGDTALTSAQVATLGAVTITSVARKSRTY